MSRWVCEGVRSGCKDKRLSDYSARWCMQCGNGPYCSDCLEGHQEGHREIEAEKQAKYPDGRYQEAARKAWARPGSRGKRSAAMRAAHAARRREAQR